MFGNFLKFFNKKTIYNYKIKQYINKKFKNIDFKFVPTGGFFSPNIKYFTDIDLHFYIKNNKYEKILDILEIIRKDDKIDITDFEILTGSINAKPRNLDEMNKDEINKASVVIFYGFIKLSNYYFPIEIVFIDSELKETEKQSKKTIINNIDTAILESNFTYVIKKYFSLLGRIAKHKYGDHQLLVKKERELIARFINRIYFWQSLLAQLTEVYPYLANKDKKFADEYFDNLKKINSDTSYNGPEINYDDDIQIISEKILCYLTNIGKKYYYKYIHENFSKIKNVYSNN